MKKIIRGTKRTTRHSVILTLLLLLLIGTTGCRDFRNGVVDAVDAAARGLFFGTTSREAAFDSAAQGIANAALDLLFDQLRGETSR